jgi:hypothetical protein
MQAKRHPTPLVIPGILSLIFALTAGLQRLGWNLPLGGNIIMLHGPLMISGFLGTVIAAERAAALNKGWAWLVVAANGLGALLLLAGSYTPLDLPLGALRTGAALFTVGGVGIVAIFAAILKREGTVFNAVMGLGALAYLNANLILLSGKPIFLAVPFWSAFLVLTIAGERLELNRFLRPKRGAALVFGLGIALVVAGALSALFNGVLGDRIMGLAFLVLGVWLMMNDIARRTVRMSGVTRYTAICLLSGYVWLVISGLSMLGNPGQMAGPHYDVNLHSLYIGFVLTMIFGHAPIIVPALTGKHVDWRGHFYLPLILLHVSLLMRIGANHGGWLAGRQWGGLLNEVALVLFIVVMVAAVWRGNRGN